MKTGNMGGKSTRTQEGSDYGKEKAPMASAWNLDDGGRFCSGCVRLFDANENYKTCYRNRDQIIIKI